MLKNILKITMRNFLKQKSYTIINILGLTIGITCCLLIILFVFDELGYESHHEKADQIYRVVVKGHLSDQDMDDALTPFQLAETLMLEYPEVINTTRIVHTPNMLVRYQDKVFNETQFLWVDSTFFELFTVPVLYGDAQTALKDHHTVVFTEETARKYFSDPADAIGKIVNYEDGTPYKITAVVQNAPAQSHFHYGMLCPLSSWEWENIRPFWLNNNMYTYILLQDGYPAEHLETKLPDFVKKYVAPHFERSTGMSMEQFYETGGKLNYELQPLGKIHLYSHFSQELEPNSDIKYVYIFSLIALFILGIACVNFMNLSIAKSVGRNKEVGMRKVLGSNKKQLVRQFLCESILMSSISLVLSVILTELLLPYFDQISNKQLNINLFEPWYVLPGFALIAIIVGIIAGSYPAFYLASFSPISIFKTDSGKLLNRSTLRNLLVVFQFSISIFLFISTFVIAKQMQFIQNKRLGFDKENVVIIKRGWAIGQNPDGSSQAPIGQQSVFETFKQKLLQNSNITSVTGTGNLPGKGFFDMVVVPDGAPQTEQFPLSYFLADYDFAETFNLELIEGRYFSKEIGSDSFAVVINETAARKLGFEKPYVGKRIGFPNNSKYFLNVVGVVKDFNFESLHREIKPLLIGLQTDTRTFIAVRIQPFNVASTLSFLKNAWNEYIPYKPFEFYFFDEDYNNLYQSEKRTSTLFMIFSLLAIIIACLGLFGLVSYTTEQRSKEIGVRKVLGSSVLGIIAKLSFDFVKWIIAANLLAWPVAWIAASNWLQNFAYRIDIHFSIFVLASSAALLVAILTVSTQTIKAAMSNPIKTLRYE